MCCRTHYSAFWKSSALSCRRNGQLCSSTTVLPLPRVPRPSAFLCFSSSSAVCRWLYFLSAPLGMVTSDHEFFFVIFCLLKQSHLGRSCSASRAQVHKAQLWLQKTILLVSVSSPCAGIARLWLGAHVRFFETPEMLCFFSNPLPGH